MVAPTVCVWVLNYNVLLQHNIIAAAISHDKRLKHLLQMFYFKRLSRYNDNSSFCHTISDSCLANI